MIRASSVLASLLALLLATAAGGDGPVGDEVAVPTATPEEEVRTLGDYGIRYTTQALQSGAQFYPFAFIMRADGKIQRVAPKEMPDFPTQDQLLQTLVDGFNAVAEEGRYRAVAIVADVVIAMPDGRESEAIQLGLEHSGCYFRNVFYPYTLSEEGVLTFGEPLSGKRRARVFTGCS